MSDPTKEQPPVTTPPPVKEQPLDWNKASKYLSDLGEYYQQFAGRRGYNPHFVLTRLAGMQDAIKDTGNRNKALYDSIFAEKQDEKSVVFNQKLIDHDKLSAAEKAQKDKEAKAALLAPTKVKV